MKVSSEKPQKAAAPFGIRFGMMSAGVFFICLCVGFYRLSLFGVDPFSCMNLGISQFIGMAFGTWQLMLNLGMLVLVFFTMRENIGLGTLFNMVFVGYGADLIVFLANDVFGLTASLPLRIVFLFLGTVFAGLGISLYKTAGMGLSPYDNAAVILEKYTHGKIPFKYGRILCDVTVMSIGLCFCLASGGKVLSIVGLGTVVNALLTGPMVGFFDEHLSKPLMGGLRTAHVASGKAAHSVGD